MPERGSRAVGRSARRWAQLGSRISGGQPQLLPPAPAVAQLLRGGGPAVRFVRCPSWRVQIQPPWFTPRSLPGWLNAP